MKLYDGRLIYQSHDDDGVLEVVDAGDVRSLHFGSSSRQSSLLLSDPDFLQLTYVRAMTAGLIFNNQPQRILNIGLGGGSLVKFLLQHFPDCSIEAVEYRKSVARIAKSHFGLKSSSRLKIIIGDGGRYVLAAEQQQNRYDLIYVDAFDHDGMSIKIEQSLFYQACRQVLTDTGIMTLNIWGNNRKVYKQIAQCLDYCFNDRVLYLPVRGRGNIIAFAFSEHFPQQSQSVLQARAQLLAPKYRLDCGKLLKDLQRNNRKFFKQLLSKS